MARAHHRLACRCGATTLAITGAPIACATGLCQMLRASALLIALFAAAAAGSASAACPAASADEIRQIYARWIAADTAHDINGTMAIFDKGVVFQFQGVPDQGWNELKASYQTEFASHADGTWSPTYDRIEMSSDLAAAFGVWSYTKDGKVTQQNVSVDLFRRDAACHWHIIHSLNYPKK
jgi:ketosteroid isomerase-like protein